LYLAKNSFDLLVEIGKLGAPQHKKENRELQILIVSDLCLIHEKRPMESVLKLICVMLGSSLPDH